MYGEKQKYSSEFLAGVPAHSLPVKVSKAQAVSLLSIHSIFMYLINIPFVEHDFFSTWSLLL